MPSSLLRLPPYHFAGRAQGCRKAALAFLWSANLIRTNVYVDGFNLYYRALRETPCRWLDIGQLAQRLLSNHQINRIRYFTARVSNRPNDPTKARRQEVYIRAL